MPNFAGGSYSTGRYPALEYGRDGYGPFSDKCGSGLAAWLFLYQKLMISLIWSRSSGNCFLINIINTSKSTEFTANHPSSLNRKIPGSLIFFSSAPRCHDTSLLSSSSLPVLRINRARVSSISTAHLFCAACAGGLICNSDWGTQLAAWVKRPGTVSGGPIGEFFTVSYFHIWLVYVRCTSIRHSRRCMCNRGRASDDW